MQSIKLSKLLYFLLCCTALLSLGACHSDAGETLGADRNSSVTLRLSAEIGFDAEAQEDVARSVKLKINDVGGQKIPCPHFTKGQEVSVYTLLRSNKGDYAAETLVWKYDDKRKALVLKAPAVFTGVSNLNNSEGRKWYIAGVFTTGDSSIDPDGALLFNKPTRTLRGVDDKEGDIIENLNIPYAFSWTELSFSEQYLAGGPKLHPEEADAYIAVSTPATFKPVGTLIAYSLGNAQTAGDYTFTPTGFMVMTNIFTDMGKFKLRSWGLSNSSIESLFETQKFNLMHYHFADDYTAPTMANKTVGDKVYYTWCILNNNFDPKARFRQLLTRVLIQGKSSRPEDEFYKDYTRTYHTDYSTKNKSSEGIVKSGKIHTLTARATYRVALPIEHVTEYNLAGGVRYNPVINEVRGYAAWNGKQLPGSLGPLRFSNRTETNEDNTEQAHNNDQSGYYRFHEITGIPHSTLNPHSLNLNNEKLIDVDGSEIFLKDKYLIPYGDHLLALAPSFSFWGQIPQSPQKESFAVGAGDDIHDYPLGFHSTSIYAHDVSVNNATEGAVLYGIRFSAASDLTAHQTSYARDYSFVYYPLATDWLKCAYRFTRIGGTNLWNKSDMTNNNTQVKVEAVYLGEEKVPTSLATISNSAWWAKRAEEGKVLTRIIPVPGVIENEELQAFGRTSYYFSQDPLTADVSYALRSEASEFTADEVWRVKSYSSVRLFKRNPEQR